MFGRERKIAKQKADIEELMRYTNYTEALASEVYYNNIESLTMDEIKARWDKASDYIMALREYREREMAFQEKIASIPELIAKPNMKSLAKAVLIQQEYIAHIQKNYVSTGLGLRDKTMPQDPNSIFAYD